MQVDCPECGASLEGASGAEMVCPACMTPFLVPAAARSVPAFDVQADGDAVLHGMTRHALREAIYTGRIGASARVRHAGGKWELIGGYPEFAAVFRLLGGDLAPMAGTRKLAGWKRATSEPEPRRTRPPERDAIPALEAESSEPSLAAPRASAPREKAPEPPPVRNAPAPPRRGAVAPPSTRSGPPLLLIGGLALAALLAAGLLLS